MRLLADLEEIETGVTQANASPRGRLRADVGASIARWILLPALPEFFALYPEIQFDLGVSDRPADLIADNVDCVLRAGTLTDQSLVARKLAALSIVTVASPGYLERHGVSLHPLDLQAEPHRTVNFFSSRTGRPFSHEFVRGTEHLELPGRCQLAVNEAGALTGAALAGMGVTQIASYQAAPHLADGSLVRVLP